MPLPPLDLWESTMHGGLKKRDFFGALKQFLRKLPIDQQKLNQLNRELKAASVIVRKWNALPFKRWQIVENWSASMTTNGTSDDGSELESTGRDRIIESIIPNNWNSATIRNSAHALRGLEDQELQQALKLIGAFYRYADACFNNRIDDFAEYTSQNAEEQSLLNTYGKRITFLLTINTNIRAAYHWLPDVNYAAIKLDGRDG